MPLTRDEVVMLYKAILNREPESERVISWASEFYLNFSAAREALLGSDEFRSIYAPQMYYIPEPHEPFAKNPHITLALATIVKNEEKTIERMILSCAPIIDYAVVVDTGSTDDTKSLARSALEGAGVPHSIVDAKFINFAQARNAALERIPEYISWTLMLDADEQIVQDDYAKWLALLDSKAEVWEIPRFNFSDELKTAPVILYPDFQRRLIRSRKTGMPIRYYKAVHEEVQPPYEHLTAPLSRKNVGGPSGGPHIHHFGHVSLSAERAERKNALYHALAKPENKSR